MAYVLLMIAVTVGMMITIVEDDGRSPTAFSFYLVVFCFVFPAILHPQEFGCLPRDGLFNHGVWYKKKSEIRGRSET